MKLNQLVPCDYDVEICGLSADSREIRPGFLFGSLNGSQYLESAINNGAAAVIVPENDDTAVKAGIAVIPAANPNLLFAWAAAKFYGGQPEHICAITGTNGKTSIADFIRQILTMMGKKAASMGTLGLIKGTEAPIPSPNTTPNAVTVQRELSELKNEGYEYVAMEMSSHGLAQYRVGGVKVNVAGFTNLTRDHLDYHKTFENYLAAKMILFTELLEKGGAAVLNADIEVYDRLKENCLRCGKRVISYGYNGKDIKLLKATPQTHGQKLNIIYYGKELELDIPLAGEFQAMNILCALGMTAEITGNKDEVVKYVTKIRGAKGRLELVGTMPNGAAVYVDYAHTPDALENVIKALRPHTAGKLHVVFGCGGDRDAGKRPIMGKLANDLADETIVTDDNPRTEDAAGIRAQIMAACPKGKEIGDRAEAIKQAMQALNKGDILIVAGKGHETGQYINGKIYHFSDQEEILKNLNAGF